VLDLVNPVGARRGLVGRRRKAGLDEARPVGGQALRGRGQESNRNALP
jgi:hypothetical protein